MTGHSARCAFPGCRAWAMHGHALCRAHRGPPGGPGLPEGLLQFYAGALTPEEFADIRRHMATPDRSTDVEVAVIRVMIRRVLQDIGPDEPAKALPLVRQAVDGICRALRTGHAIGAASAAEMARSVQEAMGMLEDLTPSERGETAPSQRGETAPSERGKTAPNPPLPVAQDRRSPETKGEDLRGGAEDAPGEE